MGLCPGYVLATHDAADDLEWHLQANDGRKQVIRLVPRFGCEDMPTHPLDLGNGTMIIDPAHCAADVAANLPATNTAFLAASQRPTGFSAFTTKLSGVAGRGKPSFGIVAREDRTLDPELERFTYARSGAKVVELDMSHVPHLSAPKAVASVIAEATEVGR